MTRDRAGRWHIAFAVIPEPIPAPGNGQAVGIDRGVAVSAALSTGEMLHAPGLTARERRRMRRLERKFARARRGSERRRRVRLAIARLKAREKDRRKDWAEKASTDIARRFDTIRVRLGYSEPCELRRLPVGRTMTALHGSSQWRKYAGQTSAATPSDVWREGCWRFVVYPGSARARRVDIVYLQSRRPAIRTAVLDADTDEVLGSTGTRESAFI